MTPSVRRFELRLRILMALHRAVKAIDADDILTVAALALIGGGITLGLAGAVVVGGIMLLPTSTGAALRIFVRGK